MMQFFQYTGECDAVGAIEQVDGDHVAIDVVDDGLAYVIYSVAVVNVAAGDVVQGYIGVIVP